MKKPAKQVINGLVLGIIGIGGWFVLQYFQEPELPAGFAAGNGRIEAVQVDISTKIAGRVETILVKEGDLLQADQILAKIDTAQFSGVVAYPGTAYYQWAKENGYLIPQNWRDWVDEHFEQVTTQSLPDLPVEEINALIDEGLRKFYLRPSQMWRMVRNIRTMADVKAKWHGFKSFLNYFNKDTCETTE